MNKKIRIAVLLILLLALLGGAYLLYSRLSLPEQAVRPELPTQADDSARFPNFSAEDQEGNPVYLSDFIDRPTVVLFWTSWCSFCKLGMDAMAEVYELTGDEVQFLAVNLSTMGSGRDELTIGRTFMEEAGFPFISIYDIYGEAERAYGVTAVPLMLFIEADGTLVHQQLGFLAADALVQYVALLTAN